MQRSSETRLALVFALLTGVTILSWWIGTRDGARAHALDAGVTVAVLLIAALKVRMIVWEFMELRQAPTTMRRTADCLLALLVATLLAVYLWGVAHA